MAGKFPPHAYVHTEFLNTAVHRRAGDVILSAAAPAEEASEGGERETCKMQAVEEGKKATGKKKLRERQAEGSSGKEDFLWWDRGVILLGNYEFHYEALCTVLAWGQLHVRCTAVCVDIANVSRSACEQVIVRFLCFKQYD